ncbi:AAA family ATPase [Moraxella sp. VT-16-12]|uniref:AAA family ATPase n=1 Tax=Moraxella sp. VT-16-12 TaxID=2014877 RepID=UPI0011B3ADB4|nr:AAA family ATPase [Moraxella sp. VT-16-12]TWV84680.1 AAA family ATPase [Moraxella sp. VT-16-12]
MRLKSLKLAGFKSFANPTTFTFKHDITAIVGPNGCGKSNVIDAIRWVLGETSAKQLRGGAMSDVIFAGVEGRAGKSLASVEMTFEHTQDERTGIRHALNLYQELTLRRQVTKEGKSDYFINGQRVRRRDVVDVFLGTGLGARSYAVIEQGMIGRIVESSPLELRAFIEEAAGVSRYQARRAETQKQLDDAKDNLARLSDLQSELKKQQNTLIAQAQSAKRYQALHDEMTQIQKDGLLKRIFDAWQMVQTKKDEYSKCTNQMALSEQHIAKAKHELDQKSQELAQAQRHKDEFKENYHNARMAEQTAEHNFYKINQELKQHDDRIEQLTTTKQQAKDDISHAQNSLSQIQVSLANISPNLAKLQDELATHQNQLTAHQTAYQQAGIQMKELTATHQQLESQKQLALAGQNRLNVAQQKWQTRHNELLKESQELTQICIDDGQLTKLHTQISTLQNAIDKINLDDDKRVLDKTTAQVGASKSELTALEKRHAGLMGEYDTLYKLAYPPKTTQAKHTTTHRHTALATLKDEISLSQAGQAYGRVLDEFLGFWLDAKIGDESCVDIVSTKAATPTAIFYPSQTHSQADDKFIPLNHLLDKPKLKLFDDIYLYTGQGVPDVPAGRVVLTQTGWIVGQFGVVQASKFGAKSDFLTQKTEHLQRLNDLKHKLAELEGVIDDKRQALKQLNAQKFELRRALDEKTAQRGVLIHDKYQAEQQFIRLESAKKNHTLKVQMNTKAQAQLADEKAEHDSELAKFHAQLTHSDDELARLLPLLQAAKSKFETLGRQTDECQRFIMEHTDKIQTLYLQQQSLLQSQEHQNKLFGLAKTALNQADDKMQQAKKHHQTLSEQLPIFKQQFDQTKANTIKLKAMSDEQTAFIHALQLAYDAAKDNLTTLQNSLSATQACATQLGADVAVAQSRLADLSEQMSSYDDGFELSVVLADFATKPPIFTDHSTQLAKIKKQLDDIGAVNLTAVAELAELESRVSPLNEQIQDITDSINKLKDAISTIDDKTKTLFLDMLNAVNAELNALFVKVFGGGQASLSLINDDGLSKVDKWRAGLVLMAQPKGKKNSRLAVLSGGEKTLTALSLIFAIFKQHPAPFCVLDEVDAPLDDANVGRFTSLIDELAQSVQFIFISHNKLAMQTAHELKGITMPTAGISSLVTVNLQQAQQYIES